MNWLVTSLVLSVVLTIVLNVALRVFPGAGDRVVSRIEQTDATDDAPRVRVFFPWKAMLVASLLLTLVVNVLR